MSALRYPGQVIKVVLTLALAVAIGFGVPGGWLWVGSQVQGDTGVSSVSGTAAMVVFWGIVFTYVALMFLAGWLQSRFTRPDEYDTAAGGYHRAPWLTSLSDAPRRPGNHGLRPLEQVFVTTTIIVTLAFFVWFAIFAESPLPNQ
jgi:hypothetical protein